MSERLYSMADFRDEMIRRGVTKRPRKAMTLNIARFGESELDRVVRAVDDIRRSFFADVVQAIRVRLAHLEGRHASAQVSCPWTRFPDHVDGCRHCKGTGKLTVGAMRAHCNRMLVDYARLA